MGDGCVWLGGGKVVGPDIFLSGPTKIESPHVKTPMEMFENTLDKIS